MRREEASNGTPDDRMRAQDHFTLDRSKIGPSPFCSASL
jgi:hypothetical protein